MFIFSKDKNKGFTLIELLVVVAIVGILASVVLVSLNSARTKARDTKRFAELRQLQNALELYRTSNSTYPTTTTFHTFSVDGCRGVTSPANSDWSLGGNLGKLITDGYIKNLPADPTNSISSGLCYTYTEFEASGGNTGWTCTQNSTTFDPDGLDGGGGISGTKYAYIITFQTETNNLALPLLWNSPKLYCLLGPAVS